MGISYIALKEADVSVETPILTIGASGEARKKGSDQSSREYELAHVKG